MKRRLFSTIFILLMLVIAAAGCSPAPTSMPVSSAKNVPPAANSAASSSGQAPGRNLYETGQTEPERMVIRNANLEIVIDDPAKTMVAIQEMASKFGGYVVTTNSYKTTGESGAEVPQAAVTIRVLSGKLDECLAQIRALVSDPQQDIRHENVTGQDITKDYTDQKSRLVNLESTEKQLQRIQETAVKTEDVLAVFRELSQVRQQIEVTKGQIKYYEDSSRLSSISVQIIAKAGVSPLSIGSWQPVGVARDALQTLINTGKVLLNLLIWIVIFFLPLGLVLYFPARLLNRLLNRWRETHKPKFPPIPPFPPSTEQ